MKLKIIKKDDSEQIIEISQYINDFENQKIMCELQNNKGWKIIDLKDVKIMTVY